MTIRSKIILITLPLLITPLILTLIIGILSTRNGITHVTTKLLTFKSKVLINYMDNQWLLLTNNELDSNPYYVEVSKLTIENYAKTMIENREEAIFAIDGNGEISFQVGEMDIQKDEVVFISDSYLNAEQSWVSFDMKQGKYISHISYFEPFDWLMVNAVQKKFFYGTITTIIFRTLSVFLITLFLSIILLMYFSLFLTRPVKKIVDVIKNIIKTNDLSILVDLDYEDEIGELGHYFNIMTRELDMANRQIKTYALRAVVAKRQESKIKNIFQKYVPKNVIDKYYNEPESMLEGDSRVLGILFSDIRQFTSFSEKMPPHEVVESLNKYFEYMVDIIIEHHGIVDKYIGDAIMAFFGAPVHHSNDALEATAAALEMIESLSDFNEWQQRYDRLPFEIGVGINYGLVTVGNIGTEKKMDYTVIGDMVNLASRLEGLTKMYREPILVSESVQKKIRAELPCRMIDKVVVKGKTGSTKVYAVRKKLSSHEEEAWQIHAQAINSYYRRDFANAVKLFQSVKRLLPDDYCSDVYIQHSRNYISNPPEQNWTGETVLNRK
jgi:adenylate cyclase